MNTRGLGIVIALVSACGPSVLADSGETGSSSGAVTAATATSATSAGSTTATTSTTSTTDPTSSTGTTTTDGMDSLSFLDTFGDCCEGTLECDVYAQDCMRGEKCMPWANDGGSDWNATKCSPIAPDPHLPGEPCTVESSPFWGVDDCILGAMCWAVDPDTLTGTCVDLCSGTPAEPTCTGECTSCATWAEGVLALCLPVCDPIGQTCPEGQACYPIGGTFVCAHDASGPDLGGAGDPCEFINVCDPGHFCADGDAVPGCDAFAGCCATLCDTAAADPCPGAAPGVECVPWWEPGQEPQDGCVNGGLGACVLP